MKATFQGKNNARDIKESERIFGVSFRSGETFRGTIDGHKFAKGDILELYGLEDYPQFNGEIVEISSIREDGSHGKAYYFITKNEALSMQLNWTYEYRLRHSS